MCSKIRFKSWQLLCGGSEACAFRNVKLTLGLRFHVNFDFSFVHFCYSCDQGSYHFMSAFTAVLTCSLCINDVYTVVTHIRRIGHALSFARFLLWPTACGVLAGFKPAANVDLIANGRRGRDINVNASLLVFPFLSSFSICQVLLRLCFEICLLPLTLSPKCNIASSADRVFRTRPFPWVDGYDP